MNNEQLIAAARKLLIKIRGGRNHFTGLKAETCEFLRIYAGPKTSFYDMAQKAAGAFIQEQLLTIMESYISFVEAGLYSGISPERKAQLDVVSDFLEQAHTLLETKQVHPAAPAVLIGATLEEFLRNWIESEGISIGSSKPGIDAYSKALRENDLITKQDFKDITAWAGIRNHASHGEWSEVDDKNRIRLMLEGVNLFLRRYSP